MARLRSRAGREFVLDAHGLTTFAAPTVLAAGWLEFIFEDFEGLAAVGALDEAHA